MGLSQKSVTCLIFTSNFIDLGILSVSAVSCYWPLVGRGQGCCSASSHAEDSPTMKIFFWQKCQ